MQASEALTLLTYDLKDVSDVSTSLFLQWCDYINKFAYRILSKEDPDRFISAQSYSVSSSPSTQALPADFRSITSFGCGLYKIDGSTQTDSKLPRTWFGSSSQGYYISGTNVVFTGINSGTYTLRYIPIVADMDDATDEFCIPDEYNRYITDALKVQYAIWDEDPTMESYSDARFVRSLDELTSNIVKDVKVYGLANYSSVF